MEIDIKNYYVPNITEFHVGFEYEVFQKGQKYEENVMYLVPPETEDKWYKFKYPDPFLGYNLDRIFKTYKGRIRVKYLDKEGIESLGFKHYMLSIYNYKEYSIERIGIDNKLSISHYGNCIFLGRIKNKSELKRLLKQLNILIEK